MGRCGRRYVLTVDPRFEGGEGLDIHSFFSIEKMRIERNVDEVADNNMERRQPGVLT